ncbi:aldehyde dehydrogenase family protein [Rhizobiaceae bacterium n13]|uniref:Aldehyde dehydrogenase family protein n=1 Tax=Ferirhizobium litorale TaxID=2927786 RepID=A0AAE3QC94_9HYPH|nr:aldehyde dehydrogenase family protein [Fererhizobium litorale]MDI7864710.1 aldehyde dehydrogenase family protein [Fererhizobium litorale]MDI7922201.1 aldehyde dehydrogenase family protein [Fererhizobium litorale]
MVNGWNAEIPAHLFDSFYIDGAWTRGGSGNLKQIISPATGDVTFAAPLADASEMDRAITAAKNAFENGPWPKLSPQRRSIFMHRLADRLSERLPIAVRIWTAQVGAPISLTNRLAPLSTMRLRYFADLAASFDFETERSTQRGHAKVISEPIGPAALIIPWNAALPILMTKLGAALAAGCTCIIKSSPESPLDAMLVAQCAHEVGIPPGVINVILADADMSSRLVSSYDVPKVSFTGSLAVGRTIASTVAGRMGRLTMELGGKSAAILLEDADVNQAMATLDQFSMPFSGQFCFSQSRILIPRAREDELVTTIAARIGNLKVGDPWDETTRVGPVLNNRQFERAMGYILGSVADGAEIVCGGKRSSFSDKGYYIEPTIIRNVDPNSDIAREEVFGPVVTIHAYDTQDEAVEIANSTDFGLCGTVFGNPATAYTVARRVRTGQIAINGMELTPTVPFGGFKMSGFGREGGPEGVQAFLETKAVIFPS